METAMSTGLQTQNLTKKYNGLTAVDDLTLEVRQGEIFGLLGPNGAGKTTSINMMCGLLEPDSGMVFIHGVPVRGGDEDVRARVGVCPQRAIFWEKLTCIEQLEFIGEMYDVPRVVARQRGDELLGILGLVEKRDKLASTLSGGMQRRLNLALGLVHDPEILVLDEPEAGLDPQSRILVREYIRGLARRKTIILTTHNMDEADRMSDRVAIIDHGKLLVVDTPEALKRTVGEGDVLEIEVKGISMEGALAAIRQDFPTLSTQSRSERNDLEGEERPPHSAGEPSGTTGVRKGVLTLRGQNIVEKLPAIIELIQAPGGGVGEVHLRANTLEDVFIALTGRRLRQ
jgi:ABC-2 type transport system ATP-binding protein